MDLRQFWEQFAAAHPNGSAAEFLRQQSDSSLRAALLETDNPFELSVLQPLLNLIAQELLDRQRSYSERLANLFAITVSYCERKLREKASEEILMLDSTETVGDRIIAIIFELIPPLCALPPRSSSSIT